MNIHTHTYMRVYKVCVYFRERQMHMYINTYICCKVKDSKITLRRIDRIWWCSEYFLSKTCKKWQGEPHVKFRRRTLEILWTFSGIICNCKISIATRGFWLCIVLTCVFLILEIQQVFCAQRSFTPLLQQRVMRYFCSFILQKFLQYCILFCITYHFCSTVSYSICQYWYANSKII